MSTVDIYRARAVNEAGATIVRNSDAIALASAVRAATNNTPDIDNPDGSFLTVFFNVAVVPGVDTVQLIVQTKDPASGLYRNLFVPTAVVAASLSAYQIGPGCSASGGLTASAAVKLPRTFRFQVVHSAVTNFTYSVGYSLG